MPINYDPINLADPQLDFDTESAILVDALRKAQELQKPQFQTYRGQSGIIAPWSPGASIGNIANKLAGQIDQRQVQSDIRALNQEEGRRFDEGIRGLGEIDPNTNFDDPVSIAQMHNAQQQKLAQLSRLPMGRKYAEQGLIKSANFPETLAQLKMRQLDAAARQDEKLANALQVAREGNVLKGALTAFVQGQQNDRQGRELGKPPTDHLWVDPNDPSKGVTPILGSKMDPGSMNWRDPSVKGGAGAGKKSELARAELASQIDLAEQEVKANPGAFSFIKGMTPDLVLNRVDAKGTTPRSVVAALAAEKAHELYGAAFTAAERARANKFLPVDGDNAEILLNKFSGMKKMLQAIEEERKTQSQSALPNATGAITTPSTMKGSPGKGDTALGKDAEGYYVYQRLDGSVYTTNPNPKITKEQENQSTVVGQKKDKKGILYNIYSDGTAEPVGE